MKAVKIILLVIAVVLVIIQFLPSDMPENKPEDGNSISHGGKLPGPVLTRLKTSCFDCHSNQTSFPWYAKLAPSSWLLSRHIEEGREHLNFSEWEMYSSRQKVGHLEDIVEEVKSGKMPLKGYLLLHRDAKLDEEDIAALSEWAAAATDQIMQ